MKKHKSNNRLLAVLLAFVMLLCFVPMFATATSEDSHAGNAYEYKYYYNQLSTQASKNIYATLEAMRDNGGLKTGTYTVDLVKEKALENKEYNKDALMADFISARDAFMFDNSALFYVNFDKLSISQSFDGTKYVITLGIGRDTTYFADGFTKYNVDKAIADFDAAVQAIYEKAAVGEKTSDRVKLALKEVATAASYALEADAKPENVDFVRTPYGALVKGETVCEGYSRALKTVLDEMEIDNVLVQGVYVENENAEPHMWNYVKMDDNRWYLLDATMEYGNSGGVIGEDYEYKCFLATESDAVIDAYRPDGVISLSSLSFEFKYPALAEEPYEELSQAFTAVKGADGVAHVSYKGLGLRAAEEKGEYVIASYDNSSWFYYERYVQYMYDVTQQPYSPYDCDFGTYFIEYTGVMAYFAVTSEPPAERTDNPTDKQNYYYYGTEKEELSQLNDAIELRKTAPVVATKSPAITRLEADKTYSFEVIYNEDLKKANAADIVTLSWVTEVEGATISDVKWYGDESIPEEERNSRKITFSVTTVADYAYVRNYSFVPYNLIGVDSALAPKSFGFVFTNKNVFGCPKIQGSVSTIYANTPALIANSDLAEAEFKDANGEAIDLPYRLSLVATEVIGEEAENYENKIENETVLASQTFDISLGLCGNQIAFVNGKKVQVFVPYPTGYKAVKDNYTFKAYHYNEAKDEMEEIECVATETGLIMMCDSFSPFIIAVVEKETDADKLVMATANGNGTFTSGINEDGYATVASGETASITVKADGGYVIDEITLNGEKVSFTGEKEAVITLSYEELLDGGNVLEVSFIVETITINSPSLDTEEPTNPAPETSTAAPETTTAAPETSTVAPETTTSASQEEATTAPADSDTEKESFFQKIIKFFKMIFDYLKKLFESLK